MNLGKELVTIEVLSVKGFRADCDGINCVGARTLESALKCTDVGIEGSIRIRPGGKMGSVVDQRIVASEAAKSP